MLGSIRWVSGAIFGVLCFFSAGCSLTTMRLPPKDPAQRAATPAKCKSIYPPLIDSSLALLGVLNVIYANSKLEGTTTAGVHIGPSPEEKSAYQIYRGIGYGALGLFGASALYGFYVHANCTSAPKASQPAEPQMPRDRLQAKAPPARQGFPASVYAFRFDMPETTAGATCRSGGQAWQVENSIGLCRRAAAGGGNPDVRVSYRFGAAYEITVLYAIDPQRLNDQYDRLYATMRERYGKPQVERTPLSAECAASLARCLENGQRPRGAVWHWPAGTVELLPTFSERGALLELRHIREEAGAP